jgi:hypothetical protein
LAAEGVGDGAGLADGVMDAAGISSADNCVIPWPFASLEAGEVGDGAGVAGSPTDAGVISSPGSFGSCAIARSASEAGGIIGGSGVAKRGVAAAVVSGDGACAITGPAAIMHMAVEIADVPSRRPKRRELDMRYPKDPDIICLIR